MTRIPVKWPAGGVGARPARCCEARPSVCTKSPRDPCSGAEYRDVLLGGSGGTNPARRFWTRLPVALRPGSNSIAIVSPLSHRPTKHSKSGFDLVFSRKKPVITEAKAGRPLAAEVE